jgi:hypothetical protein
VLRIELFAEVIETGASHFFFVDYSLALSNSSPVQSIFGDVLHFNISLCPYWGKEGSAHVPRA